jgi:ATP/maltotriose-dependent transcriptional regulator MalT
VLSQVSTKGPGIERGLAHLLVGRTALGAVQDSADPTTELAIAGEHLEAALADLREAGEQEFVVRVLLAMAALQRAKGALDRAGQYLERARHIARRCEMKLVDADIELEAGRICAEAGDFTAARRALDDARLRVLEMAYHRRDAELADLAAKLGQG